MGRTREAGEVAEKEEAPKGNLQNTSLGIGEAEAMGEPVLRSHQAVLGRRSRAVSATGRTTFRARAVSTVRRTLSLGLSKGPRR